MLLLPNTQGEEALHVFQKLLQTINSTPINTEKCSLNCSFSAGVAPWVSGETFENLIARADAALYRAKAAGRNQVQLDDITLTPPHPGQP